MSAEVENHAAPQPPTTEVRPAVHDAQWHGLRGFLKEYLIVVVGVLTAAGLAVIVNMIDQHNDVREARAALHAELVKNASILRTSLLEDQCVRDWTESALKTGMLQPPYAQTRNEMVAVFDSPTAAVWDSVRGGAVTRMPLEEKVAYANFYKDAIGTQTFDQRKTDIMMDVAGHAANYPPTPAETRALREQVLRANILFSFQVLGIQRLLAQAKALGALPEPMPKDQRHIVETECRLLGVTMGKAD